MKNLPAVLAFALLIHASSQPRAAADPANYKWSFYYDLTASAFDERFKEYSSNGYLPKDVGVYHRNGERLYSVVWQENENGRGWAEWRDLTKVQYEERWNEYRDLGYRPAEVEAYFSKGRMLYGGIWVRNSENLGWASHTDLTSEEYSEVFDKMSDDDFRLVDMEAYRTGKGLRYACIWHQNRDDIKWAQLRHMSRASYQEHVDDYHSKGYRVIDFESYTDAAEQRQQ